MAVAGQIIDGKYEILTEIGKGGMSTVYLARDTHLNKQWAVKEIPKNAKDKNNEVVVQSAIAEANLIKKLDHPSIVRIVDIIEYANVIYMIEDYIEGETLQSIFDHSGAQSQENVISWAKQICEALEYLHTQTPPIVYRDMKPANVMLKPEGMIKIIDFGIAREYKNQNLGDTVNLGTKGYAAPEQFGGNGQTDARTDIYCLGVTMYHLVTGHNPCEPPYEIYPVRYWNPQLDPGFEAIIDKCTQLNPEDRYQSCAELLYALQHYQENGAAYRKKQKNKLDSFILASALCVIFTVGGILGLTMRDYTNNTNYHESILQAEKANDDEKMKYYSQAITIKPSSIEVYQKMIDSFKEDAVFTVEEEKTFKEQITSNLAQIRGQKDYGDFAFEVGKLYWYYYDYGRTGNSDNQITRMKSGIQWFKDAIECGGEGTEYYHTACVYKEIGEFNRDINLNIEEASDNGLYKPYWNNISRLLTMVKEEENEIVRLEVCRLGMNAIETYARKFKNDGISQQKMKKLYDDILTVVDQTTALSDKSVKIKEEILKRKNGTKQAIENAYRGR